MELFFFYSAALVAVFSTVMVITRLNAVHALLFLIVSLLAVAMVFYLLGAHFAAVLEVIVYAGAIMVLFVFVIMMLNLGKTTVEQEMAWLQPSSAIMTKPIPFGLRVLRSETSFTWFTSPKGENRSRKSSWVTL